MTEVLEMPKLAQHDGVSEVNLGRGRIEAKLNLERLAGSVGFGELGGKGFARNYFDGASRQELHLIVKCHRNRVYLNIVARCQQQSAAERRRQARRQSKLENGRGLSGEIADRSTDDLAV
jgi:hypothetical protein